MILSWQLTRGGFHRNILLPNITREKSKARVLSTGLQVIKIVHDTRTVHTHFFSLGGFFGHFISVAVAFNFYLHCNIIFRALYHSSVYKQCNYLKMPAGKTIILHLFYHFLSLINFDDNKCNKFNEFNKFNINS